VSAYLPWIPKHVRVFWSDEDQGFIAVDEDRLGCSAWGKDPEIAMAELRHAQIAWEEARADAESKPAHG
jgi:predicted RNase H-like HicB family nuclease